ncbi:MAG: TAXI family TRAP transporter solute-binding subunit, partial [Acidaminococcaceae bacterium]|nr:TAXI family TRAP transporter solute-binding subunit [Acidaminococcaceae bacterium]
MRKSLKRVLSVSLAAMFMVGALAGCGGGEKKAEAPKKAPAAATEKVKINFPTASASGALYAVGAAITNNWNKTVPTVNAASQASAGGIANLNMVSEGEAQVSIAISSNAYQCMNGTDSFKGHAYKDLKAIAGLYLNPNQVVVTNKSGITSLEGVKGK